MKALRACAGSKFLSRGSSAPRFPRTITTCANCTDAALFGSAKDGKLERWSKSNPPGGVDVLHVRRPDGKSEVLIPLAQEICTRIDLASQTIVIDPPEDCWS